MLESLHNLHPLAPSIIGLVVLLLLALVADLLTKHLLLAIITRVASRTQTEWDDALIRNKVFHRLAWVMPALVIMYGLHLVPNLSPVVAKVLANVAHGWLVLSLSLALTATLSAANDIYALRPESRERPIKGFVQLGQLAVYLIGGILVVSALVDQSPVILLSGIGAMTAVLLIVFKDTLLSLAASIQLTSQKVIRVGDWLELPHFGADGDVIDVALHTITVQNWDKTITVIPTHRVVADSFKNWRGMQEAGGRRIKRSVRIDVNSIRFLTAAEIERLGQFQLLQDYLKRKQEELAAYNGGIGGDAASDVNCRRLTNIGTLRAYIIAYLRHHPAIHDELTLIVRQLQPGNDGLPIEIYCFTNDTDWVRYEGVQADIFDHICAIVPEFGLRLFQQPSGADLGALVHRAPGE